MCVCVCVCVFQDVKSRRNPRLVPYALLDERTKKSNRDSLREAIRTMVGYGYDIDPPDQEGEDILLTKLPRKTLHNYCISLFWGGGVKKMSV